MAALGVQRQSVFGQNMPQAEVRSYTPSLSERIIAALGGLGLGALAASNGRAEAAESGSPVTVQDLARALAAYRPPVTGVP